MNINEMNNFFINMKNLSSKINDQRIKTPGTMNVAEIMNRHHLENQHSNIIAFLVNPTEIQKPILYISHKIVQRYLPKTIQHATLRL